MGTSANWSLEIGGVAKKFDEWGFHGLRRRCVNLAPDIVLFEHILRDAAADPLLPYGSRVKIFRPDGLLWFSGTVTQNPRGAVGDSEEVSYTVSGPWSDLDLLFQLAWPTAGTALPLPLRMNSHVILNLNSAGDHTSAATVIQTVLQYAISIGANIQIGNIFPYPAEEFYPPISEVRDRTCAEIIRDQLRWSPSAVCWFDYSTDPPTIHLRAPGQLSPVSLPFKGSPTSAGTRIIPRYDIQFNEVLLKYESVSEINGRSLLSWSLDAWPLDATGDKLDSYIQTIDIRGPSISSQKVTIVTRPIAGNDLDWWKTKLPILDDPTITNLSIEYLGRSGDNDLPNELVSGSIDEWMAFEHEDDTLQAKMTYQQDGLERRDVLFEVPVTATNGPSGTYQGPSTGTLGDPMPLGLAKWLYDQISVLQYEGSHSLIEKECSQAGRMGQTLNLTGGHPDWAGMNSLIQAVDEEIDPGRTTLHFGPRTHLGPTDLIEYLRGR